MALRFPGQGTLLAARKKVLRREHLLNALHGDSVDDLPGPSYGDTFRIAAYLPDYALHVLAGLKCCVKLRNAYGNADPLGLRTRKLNLSDFDHSVHRELITRDVFESACNTEKSTNILIKDTWSKTLFHCWSCNRSVDAEHFPKSEIFESVRKQAGMSKIIDRQYHAKLEPVRLWAGRTITWSQLEEVWADMDPYLILPPIFCEHGYSRRKSAKLAARSGRWSREHDTLRLRDLDYARRAWDTFSGAPPVELGVQATAEYYADLYTLLRFQGIDADLVVSKTKQSKLYVCPHFDLARILERPMSEGPVDFRPLGPGPYNPKDRVIDHIARQIDQREWRAHTPGRILSSWDMPCLKQQTICCGHGDEDCKTTVSIQRLRDVGTTAWMKDLVRLKVVRRWRIDKGTGDKSWQAQNGTSKGR